MREIKMDPSLVGESSFSAANPSPYSLAEIWSFPINVNGRGGGGLELRMGSFSGFGDVATNRDVSVDESTVTEQSGSRGNGGGGHGGRKKREANSEDESSKLVSTSSGNDLNDSNGKPMKVSGSSDGNGSSKAEVEASSGEDNKPPEQVSKPSEPPKDYIHVSARRAPAIGSHSLAERVRRVKISERMKILQDLVPGCNKVTGKALLLDEIINYIQSLQRQVEFLSMKLEAVNSGLNPTMEGVPLKDLVPPTFDVAGMIFGSQAPREYAHVSQPEWLHMQMIEGESGLCNKGTVEALDSVVIDAMDVSCNCGTMAVLKTSWTNQNPGRRFYTCGKSMAGRCGFFVWCDPPMCLRARQIIPELINHISTVENQLRRRRRREICWWMVLIILWLLLWLMWSCNHEYVVKSPSIQNSKCIGYWVINYINLGTKVVLMVVQ